MNIMGTMERTLHVGTDKETNVVAKKVSGNTGGLRTGFWRSVDAALHIGTPKPSLHPVETLPINGTMFID